MNNRQPPHSSFARHLCLSAVFCSLLFLPACNTGDISSSRDFNELIPRMMNASKTKTPVEAASNLFNVTSADERRDAVAYLQTQKWGHEKPYMDVYKVLTTDPSPMVRGQACRALGSSRDPSAVEFLLRCLNDNDPTVRRDASWGLQTTFSDAAVDPLITHIKDDIDRQVRINSTKALGNSRDPKALRALVAALDDDDAAVIHIAWNNLKYLTGQNLPKDDSRAWLKWYQQTYATPAATTKTS